MWLPPLAALGNTGQYQNRRGPLTPSTLEEPGLYAVDVDDAVESSGTTAQLTGFMNKLIYSFISMLWLPGGFGRGSTIGAMQMPGNKAFEGLQSIAGRGGVFFSQ